MGARSILADWWHSSDGEERICRTSFLQLTDDVIQAFRMPSYRKDIVKSITLNLYKNFVPQAKTSAHLNVPARTIIAAALKAGTLNNEQGVVAVAAPRKVCSDT